MVAPPAPDAVGAGRKEEGWKCMKEASTHPRPAPEPTQQSAPCVSLPLLATCSNARRVGSLMVGAASAVVCGVAVGRLGRS